MSDNYAILIPASIRDDLRDTLDSVLHYEPNVPVYVLKDFDEPLCVDPSVTVIPPLPYPRNARGGLLQKKLWAFDYLLSNTDVDVVLTLDADALFIRSGIFGSDELTFEDPGVGCLGCCRISPSGRTRSFIPLGKQISKRGGLRALGIRRGRIFIQDLLELALNSDYELGEHAISCAAFYRRELLEDWRRRGWLENRGLSQLPISDDGILGLMTYASGYRIAEIGGPNGIINVSWKGLSAAPEQLIHSGAHIVHSVREFENMSESEIRSFFKKIRDT